MEFELIRRLHELTAQPRGDVKLGIGDDAAVLAVPAGHELVVAIDTLVDGVHFPHGTAAADIGWKALAVNLSDLAAMGATPAWALLALTLPGTETVAARVAFVEGFARGFAELARPWHVALVGGDTTRGPLAISVAVHGFVPTGRALTRAGAQVDDVLMVTGTLGDAAAGLAGHGGDHLGVQTSTWAYLASRLNRPTPRIAAGVALRELASACIDVSDGLLADLDHICVASGVGAEIDAARLPCSEALRATCNAATARDFALSGGDDYELCFTVTPARIDAVETELARLGCAATCMGRIVAAPGVRVRDADGQWLDVPRVGWNHFAP